MSAQEKLTAADLAQKIANLEAEKIDLEVANDELEDENADFRSIFESTLEDRDTRIAELERVISDARDLLGGARR